MDYNPSLPEVVGNEWVGISPAAYVMDSGTERGYRFTTELSTVPLTGRYYLEAEPPAVVIAQYPLISLYPSGQEASVGEVKTMVLPVASVVETGTGAGTSGPPGTTIVSALRSSSDRAHVFFTGLVTLDFGFAMNAMMPELLGKRIINVSILYAANGNWNEVSPTGGNSVTFMTSRADYGSPFLNAGDTYFPTDIPELSRISLGEMNPFPRDPGVNTQAYPWRGDDLQRFDPSAAVPMRWQMRVDPLDNIVDLTYLGLEVTYCSENRLYYGSSGIGSGNSDNPYRVPDVNTVVLRTASTMATGVSMPAGEYSITSTMGDPGDRSVTFASAFALDTSPPTAQALRELYPLPNSTFRGIEVDRAERVGERFDVDVTRAIPYISFSTSLSGLDYDDTHAYGKQAPVPVFSGSTPTQAFSMNNPTPYPWVRFWARRLSETCDGITGLVVRVGSAATVISCSAFDALPEIADGWRQVTLRFPVAPILSGSSVISWESTDNSGEQWQILSDSGQPGNGASNYGTAFLSPTYPPFGTRTTDDVAFMLIHDPPVISGVSASILTQGFTPVSLDCGVPSECIPTGISYASISWTPIATAAPGAVPTFGYYEVQRQDDVSPLWETTHMLYNASVGSVSDREARVGVASRYRIRVVTVHGILGAWSSIATATIPATAPGLWMFTSTADVFGLYSFAAPEVGETQPLFIPSYYEGSSVTYQEMYGRNNRVAFHGTERGGETFSVQLLANQGAGAAGGLGQAYAALRTLCWNRIGDTYTWTNPYVCVRNGVGDRWYAQVQIPDAVFHRRLPVHNRIQLVNATVVEILDDPVPFDFGVNAQAMSLSDAREYVPAVRVVEGS